MKITKIPAHEQSVSRWSGGTTTQLAIYPAQAVYAERDFIWRLSSAVVELPESDFTPLPDYDRILMILNGELTLSHDGGEEYTLCALEQTSFDGASHTFSRGQVTDFNLMMRKGRCTGRVGVRGPKSNCGYGEVLSEEYDTRLFYCVSGKIKANIGSELFELSQGDALLMEGNDAELCVWYDWGGGGTGVLAEMKEL
ncbi:MAG: HutD family protein [Oscillospiraceae bacterium]|nr:HutD family protein [Oscillospiraceae bacterium]